MFGWRTFMFGLRNLHAVPLFCIFPVYFIAPLGFTWVHLGSLWFTWDHLSSLEFTWVHLCSLGFPWVHLVHLGSLGFTWVYIGNIGTSGHLSYILREGWRIWKRRRLDDLNKEEAGGWGIFCSPCGREGHRGLWQSGGGEDRIVGQSLNKRTWPFFFYS